MKTASRSRWWLPIAPLVLLGAAFGAAYLASLAFARDVRLVGNAVRSDDPHAVRIVLFSLGGQQVWWAYVAVVLRMFTAPWSLAALAQALPARLGPELGWTILVLGVATGLAGYAAVIATLIRLVHALRERRA